MCLCIYFLCDLEMDFQWEANKVIRELKECLLAYGFPLAISSKYFGALHSNNVNKYKQYLRGSVEVEALKVGDLGEHSLRYVDAKYEQVCSTH